MIADDIVKNAENSIISAAKFLFMSVIKKRIADGIEDEIPEDSNESYSIDLQEYGKRFMVDVLVVDTYDFDCIRQPMTVKTLWLDRSGDITVGFDDDGVEIEVPIVCLPINSIQGICNTLEEIQ